MASSYKHGAYGVLLDSKVQSAVQASTAPFYVGLARVNLVRGYANNDLVNRPVQLINLSQAQATLGWSAKGWDKGFGISEAISAHFDNPNGNIGPIYAVNVLDPDVHRKASPTNTVLSFISRTASFISDDIVLDSMVINETVTRTLAVSTGVATYTADDLDLDTLIVYKSDGTAATKTTDYTAAYESGVLTVTLKNDGALSDYTSVAIAIKQLKAEGTDYSVSYDFGTSTVTIKLLSPLLTTNMTATYYEIDISAITPATIIGSAAGETPTGIYAIKRAYPEQNVVPSLILSPYWSEYPEVYNALVAFSQKINGHWFAFAYADIPTEYFVHDEKTLDITDHAAAYTIMTDSEAAQQPSVQYETSGEYSILDTLVVYKPNDTAAEAGTDYTAAISGGNIIITLLSGGALYSASTVKMEVYIRVRNNTKEKAIEFQTEKGYTSEYTKVFWPKAETGANVVYHMSTLACAETLRRDEQHSGVPFESIDNINIPVVRPYYGKDVEYFMDNEDADVLCASGITTLISWGGANVLWGAHTAAYKFGAANTDPRGIFDCTIRMLFYILNGFQLRNIRDIGRPMTLRHAQEIINRENNEYARYGSMGALLGDVSIEFIAAENSTADMINGDFKFNFNPTVVPPLKSAALGVAYSDAGFEAYFDLFSGGEAA